MITTGTKFFFAAAVFGFLAAVVYGLSTGGQFLGVISLGLNTGVGDHIGYSLLMGFAAVMTFLAIMSVAFRDGDVEAGPSAAEVEEVATAPQASPSPWPVVAAFGVGLLVLGLVTSWPFFLGGIGVLTVVTLEWMVQAWSDRATGDPSYNRELRNRVMLPFEIPAGAAVGIGIVVIAFSRVLLAVPKFGAVFVAIAVATLILAVASAMAWRPRVAGGVVATILVLGAIAVIGSGIVAAAVGDRGFAKEGEPVIKPEGKILQLVAKDVQFNPTKLEAEHGKKFTIQLKNEDENVEHNVQVERVTVDGEAAKTPPHTGPALDNLVLTIDDPGTYHYMCDIHPDAMQGELTVTP